MDPSQFLCMGYIDVSEKLPVFVFVAVKIHRNTHGEGKTT